MSSEEEGRLEADRLFKGLTRPPMILGVSFSFVFLNVTISFLVYVFGENLVSLVVMIPGFHAIGYLICFKEPLFLELFLIKIQKCTKCKNRLYHGANSYDVY